MSKGLSNFFNSSNGKWIFVVVVVLLIIWALMSYSNTKGAVMDNMYSSATSYQAAPSNILQEQPIQQAASVDVAQQVAPASNMGAGYALHPVANPADLLPHDKNSQWAALNPVNNSNPQLPDLLQAGNLIGLDTIGQTMKNANLQLRSDPIIVKQDVGPWNRSTYEPDLARVPLELGCGAP